MSPTQAFFHVLQEPPNWVFFKALDLLTSSCNYFLIISLSYQIILKHILLGDPETEKSTQKLESKHPLKSTSVAFKVTWKIILITLVSFFESPMKNVPNNPLF